MRRRLTQQGAWCRHDGVLRGHGGGEFGREARGGAVTALPSGGWPCSQASLAATADLPSDTFRAYNVGSGTVHTIGDMAAAIAGPDGPQPVVTGEYRLGDVRHVTASSARIAAELGWHAEVDFAAGMRDFATAPLRSAVR